VGKAYHSPLCPLKTFTGIFRLFRKKPGTAAEVSQKRLLVLPPFLKFVYQRCKIFQKIRLNISHVWKKPSAFTLCLRAPDIFTLRTRWFIYRRDSLLITHRRDPGR
jgi:hypothetical protein